MNGVSKNIDKNENSSRPVVPPRKRHQSKSLKAKDGGLDETDRKLRLVAIIKGNAPMKAIGNKKTEEKPKDEGSNLVKIPCPLRAPPPANSRLSEDIRCSFNNTDSKGTLSIPKVKLKPKVPSRPILKEKIPFKKTGESISNEIISKNEESKTLLDNEKEFNSEIYNVNNVIKGTSPRKPKPTPRKKVLSKPNPPTPQPRKSLAGDDWEHLFVDGSKQNSLVSTTKNEHSLEICNESIKNNVVKTSDAEIDLVAHVDINLEDSNICVENVLINDVKANPISSIEINRKDIRNSAMQNDILINNNTTINSTTITKGSDKLLNNDNVKSAHNNVETNAGNTGEHSENGKLVSSDKQSMFAVPELDKTGCIMRTKDNTNTHCMVTLTKSSGVGVKEKCYGSLMNVGRSLSVNDLDDFSDRDGYFQPGHNDHIRKEEDIYNVYDNIKLKSKPECSIVDQQVEDAAIGNNLENLTPNIKQTIKQSILQCIHSYENVHINNNFKSENVVNNNRAQRDVQSIKYPQLSAHKISRTNKSTKQNKMYRYNSCDNICFDMSTSENTGYKDPFVAYSCVKHEVKDYNPDVCSTPSNKDSSTDIYESPSANNNRDYNSCLYQIPSNNRNLELYQTPPNNRDSELHQTASNIINSDLYQVPPNNKTLDTSGDNISLCKMCNSSASSDVSSIASKGSSRVSITSNSSYNSYANVDILDGEMFPKSNRSYNLCNSEMAQVDTLTSPVRKQQRTYARIESDNNQSQNNTNSGYIHMSPGDDSSYLDIHPKCDTSIESEKMTEEPGKCNQYFQSDSEDEELIEHENKKSKSKLFSIAHEILTTERSFVEGLQLICEDFGGALKNAIGRNTKLLPEGTYSAMFMNIEQIYELDKKFLQELEERMQHWDLHERIGDLVREYGHFLKIYTVYIKGYDSAILMFHQCQTNNMKFLQIVEEFEKSRKAKNMKLSSFLLKPIQRIPSYRLLLQDYLQNLPVDHLDYKDISDGLGIVSEVASYINESMKEGEKFQEVLRIQSMISNSNDVVKPGRYLIKEGSLLKSSRKELQQRTFVLFTDVLFYCSQIGDQLKLINELPLAGMIVQVPDSQELTNEFVVNSTKRSFLLNANSPKERDDWVEALQSAITIVNKKMLTYMVNKDDHSSPQINSKSAQNMSNIGEIAPPWIPDSRVTMCQICAAAFTVTNRRHHCRACGKVVCNDCSSYEAPLKYNENEAARVCSICYTQLLEMCKQSDPNSSTNARLTKFKETKKKRHTKSKIKALPSTLTEVAAQEEGIENSGFLRIRKGKKEKRCWFVLKEYVLYMYKASSDPAASSTIPILGYEVRVVGNWDEDDFLFTLSHQGVKEPIIFRAENRASAERWLHCLLKATDIGA